EFRVAADVVVGVWVERLAFAVAPLLLRVIAGLEVDGAGGPVLLLARDIVATLQEQDLLSGRRECPGQRAAPGAGADDDDVVVVAGVGHVIPFPLRRLRARPAAAARSRSGRCSDTRWRGEAWRREPIERRRDVRAPRPQATCRGEALGNRSRGIATFLLPRPSR